MGLEGRSPRLEPLADEQAGVLVEESQPRPSTRRHGPRSSGLPEGTALPRAAARIPPGGGSSALGSVPPTVEALLAGRLERLDPAERALTERAAVAGRDFPWRTPRAIPAGARGPRLAANGTRPPRPGTCAAWRRRRHVPLPSRPGPRRVAYAGTTKDARAELHERFGTWLEQRDKAADEIVGYHLEQAHRYRKELDPGDPVVVGLAKRAGRVLAAAGIGAWKRADARAAANLLGRAASLLPPASRSGRRSSSSG